LHGEKLERSRPPQGEDASARAAIDDVERRVGGKGDVEEIG
jgi:hypothetical protein